MDLREIRELKALLDPRDLKAARVKRVHLDLMENEDSLEELGIQVQLEWMAWMDCQVFQA